MLLEQNQEIGLGSGRFNVAEIEEINCEIARS
jgi:hypothetical protein